jgi:signal transduction histidine kinase
VRTVNQRVPSNFCLEEGKIQAQKESIDVKGFLLEIKEELNATLKPGQTIQLSCEDESQTILSDPKILRSILFNLISNASRYSIEGKSIFLRCSSNKEEIRFSVEDQGMGIPEDDLKHIFERFFRAGNAINIQGTGLGLNIVKRYVDLLGGRVHFDSVFEKGSTFTFIIPCQ